MKKDAFHNAGEAEASIGNQWSKYYTNYTDDWRKFYYRCKKVKCRSSQCCASIYLLYHANCDKITTYKTQAEHEHHNVKIYGINENVKKHKSLHIDMRQKTINNALLKPIPSIPDATDSIKKGFEIYLIIHIIKQWAELI
ncbi:unnamed protein product [Rotaria sp. Silwood2]|nr:unnamed protein product [Rotaria sp. Silwood2]CAF3071354.1 unnamed protein product [Rotaria sp. Silwood2]CAF3329721.1 unnamed protein product [Rotaria sp. Silwood2]CAF3396728.1 unnamed protein product [Rotaria sp. Silwood2]CAF4143093.1 unnamed protein product [Rotaria sp. Silwood2]